MFSFPLIATAVIPAPYLLILPLFPSCPKILPTVAWFFAYSTALPLYPAPRFVVAHHVQRTPPKFSSLAISAAGVWWTHVILHTTFPKKESNFQSVFQERAAVEKMFISAKPGKTGIQIVV